MGMSLRYFPIWLMFCVSAGLFIGAFTIPFPLWGNRIAAKLLTTLLCVIYAVEVIAKRILQSYYPISTLKTALENRLSDYAGVIFSTVRAHIPLLFLFLLPVLVLLLFGNIFPGYAPHTFRLFGSMAAGALAFHLAGLAACYLPWSGDVTPRTLYRMDTNMSDQVEQLGMFTMLRLDVQHLILPSLAGLEHGFSGLRLFWGEDAASNVPSEEDVLQTMAIDASPNVMDVDLESLGQNGRNQEIRWLANYFNSVTPTSKNAYTGMFQGYNVIELILEGFSGYVIDPERTPTLYKLTHEGFVFHNYYTALHYTSTSNGECQTLLGLYPKDGNPITMKRTGELGTNCYFSLSQQLKRAGYRVLGYHANADMYGRLASHSNLGYDWRQFGHGLDNLELDDNGKLLWPQRDSHMIEISVDDYLYSDQPFYVCYLTISGHMPYSNNRVTAPYQDVVQGLPYSETARNYIATAIEVDKALSILLDKLQEAGKLDNTLIVATGDHIPYFDVDVLEELAGKTFGPPNRLEFLREEDIDFDVYKNSLILWSSSMAKCVEVDKVCCQVDILPTVSNLLGLEYDSRMLAGRDILSDSEGLVIFTSRCWKSDRGFYNRYNQTFTAAPGVSMTAVEQEEYVAAMRTLAACRVDSTPLLIENNFYQELFPEPK